jgi:phage terminase large subunit-like protein
MKLKQKKLADMKLKQLREDCFYSLWTFARVVEPHREYGDCHRELFEFWQNSDTVSLDNTLALMPRDHQKSHALAVRCAWEIYRNPAITIIYISATTGLAERQLLDIQNIIESEQFRTLSPNMIHQDKGKRAMWNTKEMSVDHPKRKEEGVRDPTVSTCGLTTNTTGWHCQFLAKDDVVVKDNAYTADARAKVESSCSQLASVLTTGGVECAVGTRYHPKDHYNTLKEMKENVHEESTGEILDTRMVYAVHERQVEVSGIFLWPRKARASDGKFFGFNWAELARKKAKYQDSLQFFAQYYNNPNDMENRNITRGNFQYYNRELIRMKQGHWFYKERKLNIYASMDFAYSLKNDSDYTVIVVFGVDYEFNIYVLDIIRFKTKRIKIYYDNLLDAVLKWEFNKLRAECTAAQVVIVTSLKELISQEGLSCKIHDHRPTRHDGAKEERISAALDPRYEDGKMFHYKGGMCSLLEEELLLDNPEHDDIKDALAAGLSADYVRRPRRPTQEDEESLVSSLKFHSRFGGVS